MEANRAARTHRFDDRSADFVIEHVKTVSAVAVFAKALLSETFAVELDALRIFAVAARSTGFAAARAALSEFWVRHINLEMRCLDVIPGVWPQVFGAEVEVEELRTGEHFADA